MILCFNFIIVKQSKVSVIEIIQELSTQVPKSFANGSPFSLVIPDNLNYTENEKALPIAT